MTECSKRRYASKKAAHGAVAKMGNSVRVYYHAICGGYHVTKDRDYADHGDGRSKRRRKERHDKLDRQRMKYERGDDV